jgi:peroxiredoxin
MEYEIVYKGEGNQLTDDFIDVGYMAESVEVQDLYGKNMILKRSHTNKAMSLFISFPHTNNGFFEEIEIIDKFMHAIQVDIHCYFIFSPKVEEKVILKNRLNKFQIVFDTHNEFGSMYGTEIVNGNLTNLLTKSLFLISKDGAVFYLDMPQDLDTPLDLERLQIELNKAYTTYTGVGCHG